MDADEIQVMSEDIANILQDMKVEKIKYFKNMEGYREELKELRGYCSHPEEHQVEVRDTINGIVFYKKCTICGAIV